MKDKIDDESRLFINFALDYVRANRQYMIGYVLGTMEDYLSSMTTDELLKVLKDKLEKGAKTYGFLQTDLKELDREIKEECIDLIGWSCARKYVERKNEVILQRGIISYDTSEVHGGYDFGYGCGKGKNNED